MYFDILSLLCPNIISPKKLIINFVIYLKYYFFAFRNVTDSLNVSYFLLRSFLLLKYLHFAKRDTFHSHANWIWVICEFCLCDIYGVKEETHYLGSVQANGNTVSSSSAAAKFRDPSRNSTANGMRWWWDWKCILGRTISHEEVSIQLKSHNWLTAECTINRAQILIILPRDIADSANRDRIQKTNLLSLIWKCISENINFLHHRVFVFVS